MAERQRALHPLRHEVPIVDASGRPTPQFMRQWMQARSVDEAVGVASDSLEDLGDEFLAHAPRHHAGGDLALNLDSIAGALDATKLYGVAVLSAVTGVSFVNSTRLAVYDDPEMPGHAAFAVEAGGGGQFYMGSGFAPTDLVAGRIGAGVFGAALGVLRANELGASGRDSAYHLSRANHTGTQDVSTLVPGSDNGVLYVNMGLPTWGLLMDANISAVAAIGWTKIGKIGSSLADLATRSAAALNSGTLDDARLSSNVAMRNAVNTFTLGQILTRTNTTDVAWRLNTGAGVWYEQQAGGDQSWGQAGSPRDVRIRRAAAGEIHIDNNAGGAAKLHVLGELEIGTALRHGGTTAGFFGATPAARAAAYTPTNVTTDRSFDANATTVDEVADVLGTLIADLKTYGLLQ